MHEEIGKSGIRGLIAVMAVVLVGCAGEEADPPDGPDTREATELATAGSGTGAGPAAPAPVDSSAALQADREVFEATMARARREGLPAMPLGERIGALGQWFVGSEYIPGTLEVVPEGLVVNLRQFDCVTYVESMLAMARVLGTPDPTFENYLEELRTIRYRGGAIEGYPSRLHYFSDWIHDNERMRIVQNVTQSLGGVPLEEPTDFMTAHRDLYPALESPEIVARIAEQERALNDVSRYWIPKEEIARIESGIQDGDIIAATSATEGLDVAHTGLAIWIDGRLHLMHAPLVGSSVEISEKPLAERIQGISGQDGIMVARPVGR